MTNHTPAPWVIDNEGDISGFDRNQRSSCVAMASIDGEGIKFPREADRDLILAAPDMYEALVAAKALMDIRNDYGVVYHEICNALKKARGEV